MTESLKEKILSSAAFTITSNIIRQCIGIVSIVILARLLEPEDYGIIAASLLIIQFFDVLSQTGTDQYVLSRTKVTDAELETAWTIRLILRITIGLLTVSLAPIFADFFNNDALHLVLTVSAAIPIIDALQSPGLLLLKREFKYRTIAYLDVIAKIASFIAAVAIALWMQSYWALIAGSLVTSVIVAAGSYKLHPARPRFALVGLSSHWNFSKWTLARAFVGYTRAKLDNFIVGRYLGITELGGYTVAKQLATMPHMYVTESLRDIFVSGIGGSENRRTSAADTFSRILVTLLSLLIPMVAGIMFTSDLVILSALGPRWSEATELLRALALLTLSFTVCGVVSNTLVALQRLRTAFILDLATLVLIISTMLFAIFYSRDIESFAWTRTFAGFAVAALFYGCIASVLKLNHTQIIFGLTPSLSATVAMGITLHQVRPLFIESAPIVSLVYLTFIGIAVFSIVLILLLATHCIRTPEVTFMSSLLRRALFTAQRRLKILVQKRIRH